MMNQNAIFRQQLKKIANTMNKKHITLRKECLKTCEVFQNEHLPVFPYEVCFGLFHHLIEANSLSTCMMFLHLIQNIINLGFANEQMNREIIALLTHIKSLPKFKGVQNQSKIQHLLMLLVSKNAISLNQLPSTHAIFNILMALSNQQHKMLWNKTLAIAVQISMLHLNQIVEEGAKREEFNIYLMDLVKLARGDTVKWLVEPADQFIFMTLLSELLDQQYFREAKELFKQGLVGMLPALRKLIVKLYEGAQYQLPTSPNKHWQLPIQSKLVVCMKVACKISKLYESGFELLQELVKIVSQKHGPKILSYECLNYLFGSPQWMHAMMQSSSGDLFNFLMTTIFNTIKMIQNQMREGQLTIRQDLEKYRIFSNNTLDITFVELNRGTEVKALVKTVDQITFTFFSIYTEIYKVSLDQKIEGKPPLEKTFKFLHKTVFQIIKAIISKEVPEETLQSLLKISERIINLAGVFSDSPTAGVYIKLLCRHCMPGANQKGLGHRHVQINKMILNTANCLGNLFSTACWVTLWKAFENYALYYNRYKLGQEHLQAERQSDVQILYASMESLFSQSPAYDDEYLQTILQSLVEVTYECLQNTYAEETKKVFAFERIQQIFKLNLHRIGKMWPNLMNSLLILTTSKVQQFRMASIALLNILIPTALHYLYKHEEAIQQPFTPENYEAILLEPWKQLAESPFAEVRIQLSNGVNKLVIDYGHIVCRGWTDLLVVVKKLNDLTTLQAIVDTYLDKIESHIDDMVDTIDKVQRSLVDPNQKYLCLTLIWSIGDHAYRKQMLILLRKIYTLLLQPEQMFALGTEARNSSFYILAQLLVHNCGEKEEFFWKWIFELIDKFTHFVVNKCLELRDRVSVDQVLKNMLTNLLKIYRKFFLLLEGSKQFLNQRVGQFFNLVKRLLEFRQSEVYQWTLKQVRQMLAACNQLALSTPQFWLFLQKLTQIYYVEADNKILKMLISYLPIDIYDVLTHCLSKLSEKMPLLYKLVEKIFLIRLEAEEKDIKIAQLRIFFQDRVFIQFYRKFHNKCLEFQDKELLETYQQLLTKTLHKLLLYEDEAFLVKMLPFLSSLIERHAERVSCDQVLDLFNALLKERWSQTWRSKHAKSKDPPIWLVATHQSVRLGHTLTLHPDNQLCQQGYQKMLTQNMQLLGLKPHITPEQASSSDFLVNYYDSECTMLYFMVQNYLLNEHGTELITYEQEKKLNDILQQTIHHYTETDKSSRAKNAYDVLFKALSKRSSTNVKIIARQQKLGHLLVSRLVHVVKGYHALLSEGRGNGSDLQGQTRFLLKRMSSLEAGPSVFETERQWISQHLTSVPKQNSTVWSSSRALIIMSTPLLLILWSSTSEQIRQLLSECLQLSHTALMVELQI